ncbi:probable proline--tRNA ligase, mitochondrial [Macrosteles quadrilineatus]|uniref:probable proline--tRNA ligase, mitochondrial n=1 Tax=Macrosteles quadrilineatus TaxID=74068 RepID=UPI0023E29727|nr:probable proline--tRNA ligase, mitochondrial [Macrosteles quadrilineatus]XP_054272857.1 probable proline--tRNA ligase, mitochondrial [Macrosteles quadrilineatus]
MVNRMPFCHKLSKLFQPTTVVPRGAEVKKNDLLPKSLKLMMDRGIIAHSHTGLFYMLPLGVKALDKLTRLVENSLNNIGAQKIICPTLTPSELWQKTDRLAAVGPEILHVKDRHGRNFILSPTHEESVAALLASAPGFSHKRLPLLVYQTTAKFRDEMRPRYGLIRAREFVMNDLYSFDTSEETAKASYQLVSQAYEQILETIGVQYLKVVGVSGIMGGETSHEFHYPADIGDDELAVCGECSHSWNCESGKTNCDKCGSHNVTQTKGIEVGHTFLLGTKYSAALQAKYVTGTAGDSAPLVMGSYGLGLSRLVAAALEVMSGEDHLRWPAVLAPYTLCIVPPKDGSKESMATGRLAEEIYWILQEVAELKDNVVIDDRCHMTIGRRVEDARRTGYPQVLVVGKAAAQSDPRVELINTYSGQSSLHAPSDLIPVIVDSCQKARACVYQ